MPNRNIFSYVSALPVGIADPAAEAEVATITAIDVDSLPDGIVTGSNMLQFSGESQPEVRSAVALSLLAAQRVCANDSVIADPDQWIDRHSTVLRNLNWVIEGGSTADAAFDSMDAAVHEAIIPFLITALGPAATAASMIIKALQQLKAMDENTPWITLFERESRRFEVSEYQFSYVDTEGEDTVLRMAAARLDASYGRTQVLFVKVRKGSGKFMAAGSEMRAKSSLLEQMNDALKVKLHSQATTYIRELDLGP